MNKKIALKPFLYSLEGTADLPNHPAIKGSKCPCGYIFFPRQNYGCEKCGRHGEEIENILMSGKGKIKQIATVHKSHLKELEAPFSVATIVLDSGCVIRALLDDGEDAHVFIGKTVYSTLKKIGIDDQGREIFDLRFTVKYQGNGDELNG